MGQPSRPVFLVEGPASACIINGHALGFANCGTLSCAMGINKSTLGLRAPSGCRVRRETGDVRGGTSIEQNAKVAAAFYGVAVEVHTGPNVASPTYLGGQLQAGRGAMVSGNTSALMRTVHRSTTNPVNHSVWVNATRGGRVGHPAEAHVYDPMRNGKYGPAGAAWWPWSLLLAFAAALRPWGDGDPRQLGAGRLYCGIFPDTEPHVHLRFGAVRTKPFPDATVVHVARGTKANVRSGPSRLYPIVERLADGANWTSWQYKAKGGLDSGSRGWYGNHNGDWWTHESNLSRKGGAT